MNVYFFIHTYDVKLRIMETLGKRGKKIPNLHREIFFLNIHPNPKKKLFLEPLIKFYQKNTRINYVTRNMCDATPTRPELARI